MAQKEMLKRIYNLLILLSFELFLFGIAPIIEFFIRQRFVFGY